MSISLLFCDSLFAQTLLTNTTVNATPAPGIYYSTTKINLSPAWSFAATANSTLNYYIASPDCQLLQTVPTNTLNYIMTSVPRIPGYIPQSNGYSACDVMQTIQYFDGLGRPAQTVQVNGSPLNKDLVQPFAFDASGRETIKYLLYAAPTSDGSFKTDALLPGAGVANFYFPSGSTGTQQANGIVINQAPYNTTVYELSDLNRVTELGSAGLPWQPVPGASTGHTVRMTYKMNNTIPIASDTTNSSIVSLYTVSINSSDQSRTLVRGTGSAANYLAGQLYITVSRNENLPGSGRGGTVEEYKDNEGHIVLKRNFIYSGSPATLQILSTYYVYDDMGNLAFVLPPLSGGDNISGTPGQMVLDNLCYQYQYDQRNRLVQKKLPGKGWEYMIYNNRDQVVATQDAVQRSVSPQQFTFTKYDGRGRQIISGIFYYSNTGSGPVTAGTNYRLMLQGTVNSVIPLWETPLSTGNGYTTAVWPSGWTGTPLKINYYDNYNIPNFPAVYSAPSGASLMTTGLLTASQTNILGSSNILWTVNYYDDWGRLKQIYKQHNQGGGTINTGNYDLTANTYDYNNDIISSNRKHYNVAINSASPAVTMVSSYTYDHMGRKRQAQESINGGINVVLSQNDYNEVGQLLTKHLHSTNSGQSFLQNVAYTYNERGWLLGSNAPLFSEQLQYNTGTYKHYNGNIAYQLWQSAATPTTTTYSYTYDQLNRLTAGTSSDNYNETGITYDLMGNIQALQRTYGSTTLIDNLSYNYLNSGNYTTQVQTITDAAPDVSTGKGYTFSNGSNFGYNYDPNGNLQSDASKGITSIIYNLLNLPQVFTKGSKTATYTYDANGTKIRKVSSISNVNTDYIDGIDYEAGAISFIQTEEGRAWNSSGLYHYEYNMTDHLGDSRLTFDTNTGSAVTVQQDDYFPFGMDITRNPVPSVKNEYLYNKKELQEDLNLYDYNARFYDPVVAKWITPDPLAELNRKWSPYAYVLNNPVRLTDPDGMTEEDDLLNDKSFENESDQRAKMQRNIDNATDGQNTTFNYDDGEQTGSQTNSTTAQIVENSEDALKHHAHDWDYNKEKDNYDAGTDKCNKFVYDMIKSAGADPGTPNGNILKRVFGFGSPPTAEQWSDKSYDIPHWRVLKDNETPRAGDVVAEKIHYIVATGHVGVVVGAGQTISVALAGGPGQGEILKKNDFGFRKSNDKIPVGHRSDCVFRRYVP